MAKPLGDTLNTPEFLLALKSDETDTKVGERFNVARSTIARRRKKMRKNGNNIAVSEQVGHAEVSADGGEFTDIRTDQPLGSDWTTVFERFNLDPNAFVIVNDTVRMSTWQQSKALENGDRDVVNLYSYRAQFKRVTDDTITEADIEAARKRIQGWKLPKRTPGLGLGVPVAAVLNLSDMQLYKNDGSVGGGLEATERRLLDGLENFNNWVARQRKSGRNIDEVVIVNNGDPYEGIAGNYASQLHTVQGGTRAQMNGVLDVWEAYARNLYPQFDKGQFVSVLCNHGELGRLGTNKNQTGDSDNGSAFLAETLQRVLRGRDEFDHIRWTIPNDEMTVYTDIAGVPTAFTHGHKIPGNDANGFTKWLEGQVRGDRQAHAARIWITAHRHNFQQWDLGSAWAFQCPSCDGGSKWLRDMTGKYSNSGILALLIGEHEPQGWSDVAFL